jgi:hypothetical protein
VSSWNKHRRKKKQRTASVHHSTKLENTIKLSVPKIKGSVCFSKVVWFGSVCGSINQFF